MSDFTEFQPVRGIAWQDGQRTVGSVQYGDPRKNVMFYARSVINPIKSQEMSRRFEESHIYVKIAEPGERLTVVDRPATENDKQLWPAQWNAFQKNVEQVPDGTPVDVLFPADPAIPSNLRGYGVHTVEQLASLSHDAIQSIMGGQSYVNKAKSFMEQSSKGVAFHRYEKDLADRDSQIRVLTQQLDLVRADFAKMQMAFQGAAAMQMQGQVMQVTQAGPLGGRPVFPQPMMPSTQMYPQAAPGTQPTQQTPDVMPLRVPQISPAFDSQSAQINAVQAQTVRRGRPPGSKNKSNKAEVTSLSAMPKN